MRGKWTGIPLLLMVVLVAGTAAASHLFPPGTTFVLPSDDPITAKVEDIALWPGTPPGSDGVAIQEVVEESNINPSRAVSGVTKPAIQAFVAAKPAGAAVLVIPGGGYRTLVWDKEGVEIARWLNSLGIDAYVLKYRLPNEGHKNGRVVPLQDAQRAMRLIRARQPTAKVGALGFSAGGHLAGMVGTTHAKQYYSATDSADKLSARPDFLVLIYAPSGGGTAPAGADERAQIFAGNSIVSGINADTPPTFIVQGAADSRVPARNAQEMFAALQKAGVKSELHVFPGAEHGFALRGLGVEKQWPTLYAAWMQNIGLVTPNELPTLGKIERLDPAFDQLVDPNAVIELLAEKKFEWAEGPVWDFTARRLLFSDVPRNMIWEWSLAGGLKKFLQPSGYTGAEPFTGREPGSNGLAFIQHGADLVLCQHGDRRVAKLVAGQFVTLADKYQGKRLNSPNDLAMKGDGSIYFTDPPYGLPKGADDPAKELDFQGVYRLSWRGELTLLTRELSRPNGLAFSPDERTLYVANSDPQKAIVMAYPVKDDGTLGTGKVFFDATPAVREKKPGLPDGLKVSRDGTVWATGPGGVLVYSPQGKHLGTLATGVPTANVAFGDDGSTLFITADKNLARVRTKVKMK
jgi:gluconolactonase